MKKYVDEAIKMYSGDKEYMVYVDKLESNLKRFNNCYQEIKELFTNEDIFDYSHLPQDVAVRARFVLLFNNLNKLLDTIKVQGFSWKKKQYGEVQVEITEEIYLSLLQRYKELIRHSNGTLFEFPYDINPHISKISTGKIDSDYMNSRFVKFMKLRQDVAGKELIDKAEKELIKSFSMLPEEEQLYAQIVIREIQLGDLVPVEGKTFRDYITEKMTKQREGQISRFSSCFGLDEKLLKKLMAAHLTETTINEHGWFGDLKDSADTEKVENYFKTKLGDISPFRIYNEFDELLRNFIISGGFDI